MINLCELYIGRKGTGKSTAARARADEVRDEAFVLVHDPAGGFPETHPVTQMRYPVRKHTHLYGARHAMSGSEPAIECVVDSRQDPIAVLRMAETIADETHKPCVLVLDEGGLMGTLSDTRGRGKLEQALDRLCFIGRHLNVGLIIVAQNANLFRYTTIGEATKITLFHTTNRYCLDKLRAAGNVPDAVLERAKNLEGHSAIVVDVENDLVVYPEEARKLGLAPDLSDLESDESR